MSNQIWSPTIESWLAWLAAGGAPKTTLGQRGYQLSRFARHHTTRTPWSLTTDDLATWLASHKWGTETLRSYRSALRSFYGWAHASGITGHDPSRLLRKVPGAQAKPRPAAEDDIADALANATDREYLMVMLGSRHGLRRAEIAKVSTFDVTRDWSGNGFDLLVHGKGAKERSIPLSVELAGLIRAAPPGWLFPNGKGTHLTPDRVGRILRSLMRQGVTPHMLRHRFASRAYQATKDIRAVQELLGHASVATTQRYTAVADGALRSVLLSAA